MFREVNESIEKLSRVSGQPITFVCECLNMACTDPISIGHSEYEDERRDPTRFFVLPGHELLDVESVIKQTPRYHVVRKLGVAGEIATALDPRADDDS